jgi:putative membrane protein
MILPGISGSLMLILLGKYETVLNAVHEREWITLFTFALGCLIGLMVFSRLLKWLLARYHTATIFTLAGLMLGTLFKVWPWKDALNTHNISPLNHPDPKLIISVLLMLTAGFLIRLMFSFDAQKNQTGTDNS